MKLTEEQILKRLNKCIDELEWVKEERSGDMFVPSEIYYAALLRARELVKQSIAEAQKEK